MTRNSLPEAQRSTKTGTKLSRLYEIDETAWLEQMSQLVHERRYGQLDYKNLGEFLADMAKRDKREVSNRLRTLLVHLLKWEHQPRKRSRSWEGTILTQRYELQALLESRTLKNYAREILAAVYPRAVKQAAKETGLAEDRFPEVCPHTLEDMVTAE
jgi:hypothetical protein